ncbi:MAG: hypothetical protein KY392_07000 [Chloroflexi bacterium]|nr:hypothetical protein [Chloroflexota bacterium]
MTGERPGRAEREDGPTEFVEDESGELVERLSGGTATMLLIWLIGIGALSTLLATWLFVWAVFGERLGVDVLFGGFGIYTSIAGATGPCVLWLAGRAQGHSLAWFLLTSAKIALVMLGIVLITMLLLVLVMAGALPAPGALLVGAVTVVPVLVLSAIWGLATWAADRWIARARVTP